MSAESGKKLYCRKCKSETNHMIVGEKSSISVVEVIAKQEDGLIKDRAFGIGVDNYVLAVCKGCETPNMVIEHWSQAKKRGDFPRTYFPPKATREMPPWVLEFQVELMELFSEVYRAISNNMPRLALMGLRTIFDVIAVQKVGDVGSFDKKLDTLEAKNLISSPQRKILEAALNAGSAAAHRGFKPSDEQIIAVTNIVEHIAEIDHLARAANILNEGVPSRKG